MAAILILLLITLAAQICGLVVCILKMLIYCSRKLQSLFPLQSRSHMVMFERLMKGLAERGHEVDVLSHFPQEKPIRRYTDIDVRGTIPIFVNNLTVPYVRENLGSYWEFLKFLYIDCGTDPCSAILKSPVARRLKATNRNYDLVIAEVVGADCILGFAHHFKVPLITMTTSVNFPWDVDRIGNPDNPSYIPNYLVPYGSRMSLLERLVNTVILLGAKLGHHVISRRLSNTIAREFFGPNLPDLRDIAYNTSLMFVNTHFSINKARPTVPNLIEVGGLHMEPPRPLSKHFEDLLDVSKYEGVIYLSTGSMILTETMLITKLKALFEAFRELPYRVLWKAAREDMPKDLDIPPNIHFESWLPQLDILCHPNVRLFVTHGGLMGTQEAVYCAVPRLGFPLFADQAQNLKESEDLGIAIMMEYNDITKESVLTAAKKLLENSKYKENVEKVSKLFKDRPLSALDTAVYWTEYVIKHNGASHLRTVGADLPWYQYHLVDVGAILSTFIVTLILLTYYLSVTIFRALLFSYRKLAIKIKRD